MRDDWQCHMKSSQAFCHSFGHIFYFFGICFAHAASLICLLHALAFWVLIQCIIDAHLAAKMQLLCLSHCLHAASRDVPCDPVVPLRDGRSVQLHWGWAASFCVSTAGAVQAHGWHQQLPRSAKALPWRAGFLWPPEPQVRYEREPRSCAFCALMHFLLVIIRNRKVKNRHGPPYIP